MEHGEREQLAYQLQTRFEVPKDAAASVVREAEQALVDVRQQLAEAEETAAQAGYVSDPLPFMRQSVAEEVETLDRVSNEKRVRASYRFLIDRAVELAGAEVQGFHDDLAAQESERTDSVPALRAAAEQAETTLEEARAMQQRVLAAEEAAQRGLAIMVDKLRAES